MNIHLLGLPWLKTHKQYLSQAQMQKIIAFPEMMKDYDNYNFIGYDYIVKNSISQTLFIDDFSYDEQKYFWIEKLKELQLSINHCSNYVREVSLDRAKSALEQAFSPKIRDTLIDQYRKKIDELENE